MIIHVILHFNSYVILITYTTYLHTESYKRIKNIVCKYYLYVARCPEKLFHFALYKSRLIIELK